MPSDTRWKADLTQPHTSSRRAVSPISPTATTLAGSGISHPLRRARGDAGQIALNYEAVNVFGGTYIPMRGCGFPYGKRDKKPVADSRRAIVASVLVDAVSVAVIPTVWSEAIAMIVPPNERSPRRGTRGTYHLGHRCGQTGQSMRVSTTGTHQIATPDGVAHAERIRDEYRRSETSAHTSWLFVYSIM